MATTWLNQQTTNDISTVTATTAATKYKPSKYHWFNKNYQPNYSSSINSTTATSTSIPVYGGNWQNL
jgi:hypothetical protein